MLDQADVELVLEVVEKQLRRARFPGTPGAVCRQVVALGKGFGQLHVALTVARYTLVRQQRVTIVLDDVVFIGQQQRSNRRVILVGHAGVGVDMGDVLLGKALHRLLD